VSNGRQIAPASQSWVVNGSVAGGVSAMQSATRQRFFLCVDKFLPDCTVKTVLVMVQFVWTVDFGVWSCFQLRGHRFIGFRSIKIVRYRKEARTLNMNQFFQRSFM